MSALSHLAAHEIARDLGCLVSSRKLARSSTFATPARRPRVGPGLITRLSCWFRARQERLQTVRELRRVPRFLLEDIGLTRSGLRDVAADMTARRSRRGALSA